MVLCPVWSVEPSPYVLGDHDYVMSVRYSTADGAVGSASAVLIHETSGGCARGTRILEYDCYQLLRVLMWYITLNLLCVRDR